MQITTMRINRLKEIEGCLEPCVATVGFFDGVHRGHQFVISQMKELAAARGLRTTAVTFAQHPRQVLSAITHTPSPTATVPDGSPSGLRPPQLLTTLDEKRQLLAETGIDSLVVLPFDHEMARLTARQFMQLLSQQVGAKVLLTGYDNRFGCRSTVILPDGSQREEGFADYVDYGRELGIEVIRSQAFDIDGVNISSSKVRNLLLAGDVETAARYLGRPYSFSGRVVEGRRIGRQLGFPTANIEPSDSDKLLPAGGVYGVMVRLDNSETPLPGMMNIGTCPTFDGTALTVEIHLFDYESNLYGRQLSADIMFRQRGEQKFETTDNLVQQLQQDAKAIHQHLTPTT